MAVILLVGAAEEGQVVLVDVLGDVEPVRLDQLLVLGELILRRQRTRTGKLKELSRRRAK